jgi:hypothetical protein
MTIQYYFCCGHPATHRFRNQLCQQSKGRSMCRIRDVSKFIDSECRRCALDRLRRAQSSRPRPTAFDDVWYIPTRCFVDIGFRTLDPFLSGSSEPKSPLTGVPTLSPLTMELPRRASLWENPSSPRTERSPIDKFFPKFLRLKKTSPCCDEKSFADAFQAVRLEDYDARIEGRIMDNHCESLQ